MAAFLKDKDKDIKIASVNSFRFSKFSSLRLSKVKLRHDTSIRNCFGSDSAIGFLNSSTIQTYMGRGTNYRKIIFESLCGILVRRPQEFAREEIIKSLNLLIEIIERSHSYSVGQNFSELERVFGHLMNKLITIEGSAQLAYKAINLNKHAVSFIALNDKLYA